MTESSLFFIIQMSDLKTEFILSLMLQLKKLSWGSHYVRLWDSQTSTWDQRFLKKCSIFSSNSLRWENSIDSHSLETSTCSQRQISFWLLKENTVTPWTTRISLVSKRRKRRRLTRWAWQQWIKIAPWKLRHRLWVLQINPWVKSRPQLLEPGKMTRGKQILTTRMHSFKIHLIRGRLMMLQTLSIRIFRLFTLWILVDLWLRGLIFLMVLTCSNMVAKNSTSGSSRKKTWGSNLPKTRLNSIRTQLITLVLLSQW